jgi:hypothetical protein
MNFERLFNTKVRVLFGRTKLREGQHMAKQELLIQLVMDGRAVWQVRQEVAREHCRKMSADELKSIGQAAADRLSGFVRAAKAADKVLEDVRETPEPAASGKKKR